MKRESRSALDMSGEEFRSLGHALIEQIAEFYETLPERQITSATRSRKVIGELGTNELPEHGTDAGELLSEVAPILFDNSLHNGHPKFLGYVTSSAAPLGALADLLASAVNSNVSIWELSPVASEIETQAIRWIADLINYEPDCGGLMVSGGNMANFLGFIAARCAITPWDIRSGGNYGDDRRLTVYASRETHTWIEKAADVSGLGTDAIRWIDTDGQGRINLEQLEDRIVADRKDGCLPFLVVGTAGSVSTGALDPIQEMSALCREQGIWFHIDGAYGAPAAVLPEAPAELHALHLADSIAIDPHKWLYCPLEAACVLTRHKRALQDAFSFRPEYYLLDDAAADSQGTSFYEHGMQNSRGFRALKVWLALRRAGRSGYRDSIRDDIRLANRLYERVNSRSDFEARTISLSVATFRYVPEGIDPDVAIDYLNSLNKSLLARLQQGGELFLSNAIVDGDYLLRACVVNFRTTNEDIDQIPSIVAREGKRLDDSMRSGIRSAP
jgi:aromatic-L-amino-acid decarboxylase